MTQAPNEAPQTDTVSETVSDQSACDGHGPITVAVVYGGQSTEHSISCISAAAVIDHLDRDKYTVVPIGITREGVWVPGTVDTDSLRAQGSVLPEVRQTGASVQLVLGSGGTMVYASGPKAGETFATIDLVFPVLHGMNGEDGTIQGLFDLAGVPYVGNGVMASAASMDKEITKRLAREAGIPVGREVILHEVRDLTDAEKDALGLPVFVKPARGGSSIGVSKVDAWKDLDDALKMAFDNDTKVLIESMIHGREVECGVLQYKDGTVVASVPAMLEGTEDGAEGFYGFEAKYIDSTTSASIPASLDDETTDKVRDYAVATFRALCCEGLARVDFFVTDNGPVLNEINTLPGFTPISMYPKMFAAEGIDFAQLVNILIERALR